MVDSALTEQQEMHPGEQSERFCCYFPGDEPAPNGEIFPAGYYTRYAWLFVLGFDGLPEDLVTGAGPSIDTLPPGYRVKTEPIDVIEAVSSNGGVSELKDELSDFSAWRDLSWD